MNPKSTAVCYRGSISALMVILLLVLSACTLPNQAQTGTAAPANTEHADEHGDEHTDEHADEHGAEDAAETLPLLTPLTLAEGETLQVAATTSILGDIVARIGGDQITLFTLMPPGIDPHSYAPTPQDLRTLSDVDVIFINGLHLEEGLEDLLNDSGAPQVPVNVTVELLAGEEHAGEEHADEPDHGANDPHTWQSVANVMQWVTTIEQSLSTVDPANAEQYHAAAVAYQAELTALESEIRTQIETIPPDQRKLVTDHESFNYFAHAYGFTVIGTIVPSLSSMAESSAQDLAALQDQISAEGVQAIFVGTTVNSSMAEQLANDLDITVVPIYSDALSAGDGPAATYLDFMRYNVDAIVTALQ